MTSSFNNYSLLSWISAVALLLVPHFVMAQQTNNAHCLSPDFPDYCRNRVQSIDYLLDCLEPSCQVPGQLDFYGLGVRLGIYFAWYALRSIDSSEGDASLNRH